MLYTSTYYGISGLGDDTLAHHGIKGQKWGVRRFQNADGTYTQAGRNRYFTDDGSLSKKGERAYRKDLKKLNKLKARADISQQKKNIEKYEKRADTAKKVGLAAASVAGAMAASSPLNRRLEKRWDRNVFEQRDLYNKLNRQKRSIDKVFWDRTDRIAKLQPGTRYDALRLAEHAHDARLGKVNSAFAKKQVKLGREYNIVSKASEALDVVEKGKKVVGGAAALTAAGAGATYVYSKIQANAARKRISDIGHEKAVADVNRQIEHMKQTYGNVKLSDLDKKKR